jgi:nucleoside-diphosphate-sugar epimerase
VRGAVLVTGAAGEMGVRLIRRLMKDDWRIRGLVLPGDPLSARLDGLPCEVVRGDVRDPRSLMSAVDGIDTVFHVAAVILAREPTVLDAVNRQGTANMVKAAADAGVRHLVYVSSASVTYPRLTPYGVSKLEAERLVRSESRFSWTIVRPTLVYDRNGGQEFMLFLNHLLRFPLVPFIGPGTARKSPVFAEDVVDGLARMAGNPIAFGKTYNLSGGESITIEELARLVLERHGLRKPFIHLPVGLCRVVAAGMGLVMDQPPLTQYGITGFTNHADLDCEDATRDLGYRPMGARAGIPRCFGVSDVKTAVQMQKGMEEEIP